MSLFRPILITCLVCVSLIARADTAINIYWPMNDGDTKNFSGYGGKSAIILAQDNAHGDPRFFLNIYYSTNDAPATNYGGTTSYAYGTNAILSFGASSGANALTFSPPWPMLNNNLLTSGGTASSGFTATIGTTNIPFNATTTLRAAGNVTIPAGLFRDCWSVKLTLQVLTKKISVQDFIIAPRVGIIRIGMLDTNFQVIGWQSLTGGTIGGRDVSVFTNLAQLHVTKKPAPQTVLFGGTAKFTAAANGNDPLTYQWLKDGTALTDDARISGATTTNLTIAAVQNSDAGSYALIVGDRFGNITSSSAPLIVQPDPLAPTVTITAPALNAPTNNPVISGTATDNIRVAHVFYWFTNHNNGVVTVSAINEAALHGTNVAKMTWDATASPLPGTNILVVRAQDFQGNNSAMMSRPFFYQSPSLFTLTKAGNGNGSFAGKATNTTMLNIGEGYAITANPDTNSFLTNWTSSLGTITNATVTFIMEPNFSLQANFVTNLFIRMAGTYHGLFFANNTLADARVETAGLISSLKVSGKGVYSGKLVIGGMPYPFSGNFNMGGQAANIIPRPPAQGGKLTLSMYLDWFNDHRIIGGSVSGTNGGPWSSPLGLIINTTDTNTSLAYTMLLPPAPNGTGSLLLTNHAGTITLTGTLADGAAPSQTVPVSETLSVPIYASLYANSGFLFGWLSVDRGPTNVGNLVPNGNLLWLKKPSHATQLYTNGFTNLITVQGSTWTMPPRGTAALPFTTNNPGTLDISGGALSNALSFQIAVTTNNALVKLGNVPTNSLTGAIDPKTGQIKVTFGNGIGRATTSGQGAILQITTNVAGAFLGKTNSGSITLH